MLSVNFCLLLISNANKNILLLETFLSSHKANQRKAKILTGQLYFVHILTCTHTLSLTCVHYIYLTWLLISNGTVYYLLLRTRTSRKCNSFRAERHRKRGWSRILCLSRICSTDRNGLCPHVSRYMYEYTLHDLNNITVWM